jgi:hypothetical protein
MAAMNRRAAVGAGAASRAALMAFLYLSGISRGICRFLAKQVK